ncbi:hypothetical protein ACET3X_007848 [Alternaria dauci]|uniref:Heterokaryon incompatibility domain-containing protein n=1 Tax=Alternaria dauci TaxID=48095 RepID=A0ABR3UE13_9PLEO
MPPKKQAPNSTRKRRRHQTQDEPVERLRKSIRHSATSDQMNGGLQSPPRTPTPVGRGSVYITDRYEPHLQPDSTNEPGRQYDTQSATPQSAVKHSPHTNLEGTGETAGSSAPIILQKLEWAPPSSVKIKRLGFNTPTGAPPGAGKGCRLAGAVRQVIRMYSYTRISKHQSRLLLIKPGAFDDQISASLLAVDDDRLGSSDVPYAALSYNWGVGGDGSHTIIIQDDPASLRTDCVGNVVDALKTAMNHKMLKVQPNLHEALKHLRNDKYVVSIWVDALCINQFDITEKEEQVLKMAQIYRKAYNVNIWLGSDKASDVISDRAMTFIPKVIDLENHSTLLTSDVHIEEWASLYELLKWSWFSRRWVVQELAFAQSASVHCGRHKRRWSDFQTAIAIFDRHFNAPKPRLIAHYASAHAKRIHQDDDSTLEIEQLGAKLLVDMTSSLFRKRPDGSLESTKGLESLVCSLSGFDTSDPRDTINAFRSISKEADRLETRQRAPQPPPAPSYSKDLFEVYRDFVKWVIADTGSLDIICRHWALKERKQCTPTTPRLVELPSWILFVEDSTWGKGEELFRGRKAGDSFVGMPDGRNYNACASGMLYKQADVKFPKRTTLHSSPKKGGTIAQNLNSPAQIIHDMSLSVKGVIIGNVSFRTDPFPDGVITKDCLEGLGWSFDRDATEITDVPDQLWQTLVADRSPKGSPTLPFYKAACQHCLTYQTNNGHININTILRHNIQDGEQSIVNDYLCRVRAVTWNRSFIKGDALCHAAGQTCSAYHGQFVGFGPPKTERGDMLAILYGCSVPVVLRPVANESGEHAGYLFVGEAYVYGNMEGEAFNHQYEKKVFKIL